jgi:hypothetical protein
MTPRGQKVSVIFDARRVTDDFVICYGSAIMATDSRNVSLERELDCDGGF